MTSKLQGGCCGPRVWCGAILPVGYQRGAGYTTAGHAAEVWPENGTLIPDGGWRLWVDREAEWKQDVIFLPEDVSQDAEAVVRGKGEVGAAGECAYGGG